MTARAGGFYNVYPTNPSGVMRGIGGSAGGFYAFQLGPVFKNQGWYATGNSFETWLSIGTPNATPPTGHALTQI